MNFTFGKKKFGENIPLPNEAWIRINRDAFKEWSYHKHKDMGNCKGIENREIFYHAGYDCASLALRYRSNEPKGTTGRPLSYNAAPAQFKADLEGLYEMLLELKNR